MRNAPLAFALVALAAVSASPASTAAAAPGAPEHAQRAATNLTIYVDPKRGSDQRKGTKRAPVRSLDQAWRLAKDGTTIRIKAGKVKVGATYYESKQRIKIIGAGMKKTTIPSLNIFGVKDFTLSAVSVAGDVHCEACDGFTLAKVRVQPHHRRRWCRAWCEWRLRRAVCSQHARERRPPLACPRGRVRPALMRRSAG